MKTLQNNFTTPEQSKRLLELGVPADSSDCYYAPFTRGVQVRHEPYELRSTFFGEYPFNPCWSVGRLIEIYNLCAHGFYTLTKVPKNLIEHILSRYDWEIRYAGMDFSKLEE